ncbi:MAG: amino acid permease [Phycisphaerales bacterium]|jgi:amino acid transporter/mannitol/fructose-specific phosphotransferase system IIA component (Ntr-type)|nr:amino acid permease [Phycisphaerales bacterium]
MANPSGQPALRKDISLFGVFAIALGTTISGGLFLLPGIAFERIGPAILVAYLVAGLVTLPPLLCMSELATAMPKAGGFYFYVDRAFGPLAGTIAGLGTWITLTLKTAFALVGVGFYLGLYLDDPPVGLVAAALAVLFGGVNLLGAGKASHMQSLLVLGVLAVLAWFIGQGSWSVESNRFTEFWPTDEWAVASMVGVVLISYMGLTKVVSVAEEVRNPERNIPRGILLALAAAILIYMAGLAVMIGTIPSDELAATYTPAALAAEAFSNDTGRLVITLAAIASFLAVANAGVLSASRYPLAMGRDHIFPAVFRRLGRFGTPLPAITVTVALIILEVLVLDPFVIAKYAGTLKLLLFGSLCAAVIIMRSSRLDSYDPGFRTPLYPWVPIIGMVLCVVAVGLLGWVPIVFALGLIVASALWFRFYATGRVRRYGAIYHVFARLGENRFDPLDRELRGIIKEKGLRAADPFEEIIAAARVIESDTGSSFEHLASLVSEALAADTGRSLDHFQAGFLEGTQVGATPVTGGVALPHLRLEGLTRSYLVLVRCREGLTLDVGSSVPGAATSQRVQALFFMASPEEDPAQHLRLLASLAGAVDQDGFMSRWLQAEGPAELKAALLRSDFSLTLTVDPRQLTGTWIGRSIASLQLPDGILVALVYRGRDRIIPTGRTVIERGDKVIVIGEQVDIEALRASLGLDTPSAT